MFFTEYTQHLTSTSGYYPEKILSWSMMERSLSVLGIKSDLVLLKNPMHGKLQCEENLYSGGYSEVAMGHFRDLSVVEFYTIPNIIFAESRYGLGPNDLCTYQQGFRETIDTMQPGYLFHNILTTIEHAVGFIFIKIPNNCGYMVIHTNRDKEYAKDLKGKIIIFSIPEENSKELKESFEDVTLTPDISDDEMENLLKKIRNISQKMILISKKEQSHDNCCFSNSRVAFWYALALEKVTRDSDALTSEPFEERFSDALKDQQVLKRYKDIRMFERIQALIHLDKHRSILFDRDEEHSQYLNLMLQCINKLVVKFAERQNESVANSIEKLQSELNLFMRKHALQLDCVQSLRNIMNLLIFYKMTIRDSILEISEIESFLLGLSRLFPLPNRLKEMVDKIWKDHFADITCRVIIHLLQEDSLREYLDGLSSLPVKLSSDDLSIIYNTVLAFEEDKLSHQKKMYFIHLILSHRNVSDELRAEIYDFLEHENGSDFNQKRVRLT